MRVMFDLEQHGNEQLERSIHRLPPGHTLTLAGSGLSLEALAGGARRFRLSLPPKVQTKPHVNLDAFKAASTAASELVRLHEQVMEELDRSAA